MNYISAPIDFNSDDSRQMIVRDIDDRIRMLDNLVELIVFTPRGSFAADPDFGFEYWNHEFSNVQYRAFNNDQMGMATNNVLNEITRDECHESIQKSLATYAPQLLNVVVNMKLDIADNEAMSRRNVKSKYVVSILVEGKLDDGTGTTTNYVKKVNFLIEPTLKKKVII